MKPFENSWKLTDNLNLNPIRYLSCDINEGLGWSEEKSVETERLYRLFLKLCAKYPDKALPPSKDIDQFWHLHILDTSKYMQDCEDVFGQYLHHFPYFGKKDEDERACLVRETAEMARLMRLEFSVDLPQIQGTTCGCDNDFDCERLVARKRPQMTSGIVSWN